jgi:hypothetical protein
MIQQITKRFFTQAKAKNPQVYFDISIASKPAGRLTFELFSDVVPKTAENFK